MITNNKLIFIKNFFSYIIFSFLKLFFGKNKNTNSENIALLNTGALGDVVISSMILDNEESFTDYSKIIFIVQNKYLDLFFSYNGKAKLIGLNLNQFRYNLIYKIYFILKLRKQNVSGFYNLTAERGFSNDEISFFSGANNIYTICSKHTFLGYYFGSKLDSYYTEILFPGIQNEYQKHTLLINKITNNSNVRLYNNLVFTFDKSKCSSKYILIAPFSSNKSKQWDINKFKELSDILSTYCKIILVADKNEINKLKYIKADNQNIEYQITDLKELIYLINYSLLFIGNDSGPAHIAFKLNKKSIIILSDLHYNNCFPFDLENANIKYANKKNIKDISVEEILKLCKDFK